MYRRGKNKRIWMDSDDDDSSSSDDDEDKNKRIWPDSDDDDSSSSDDDEEPPILRRRRPIKKRFALSDSEDDSSSEEESRPPTPKQRPKQRRKPKPKPKVPKDENPYQSKRKVISDPRLPINKWIEDNPGGTEMQYVSAVASLPELPPTREERILDAVRDFVANFYVSQLKDVRKQMDRAIRGVRKYLKYPATDAEIQNVLEDEMAQGEAEKYKEDMGLLSTKSKRRKIEYVAMILKKEFPANKLKLKGKYTYVEPIVERKRALLMNKTNMDDIDTLLLQHGYALDGYAENRRWLKGLEEKAKSKETVDKIFKRLRV